MIFQEGECIMYCPQCGAQTSGDFCAQCGAALCASGLNPTAPPSHTDYPPIPQAQAKKKPSGKKAAIITIVIVLFLGMTGFGVFKAVKGISKSGMGKTLMATGDLTAAIHERTGLDAKVQASWSTMNGKKTQYVVVILHTAKEEEALSREIDTITALTRAEPEFANFDGLRIVLSNTKQIGPVHSTSNHALDVIPIREDPESETQEDSE